ncbi:MAG: DNA primase [Candidatus Bathyarchaeota archaeon]|nr:DNA primase [Candidatus Bathyarchaeota archaeon]
MSQYFFPKGMRYATIDERLEFYTQEFNLQGVAEWFSDCGLGGVKFAVIIGRHTKIFPEKYRQDYATTIIIDEYPNLRYVQAQIVEFLPEAVYYDRNLYDAADHIIGQELAFDLDPENITCPIHGSLEDKMRRKQGLSFCELELNMVRSEAAGLFEWLEHRFSGVRVVYSGRGFHLHVSDPQATRLNTQQRLELSREVKAAGFHIDEWVTSGEFRLIRLPFSLNGLVSRVVLPIEKTELASFDALHDPRCIPRFLNKSP